MNNKVRKMQSVLMGILLISPMTMMSFETANPASEGPAFKLSNNQSTVNWKGMKPGGEHYGEIEEVTGTVDTDGDKVTGGNFVIDMNTISCKDLTSEAMNSRLVGHLKSEDFFHTDKYPKAYFNIKRIKEKQVKSGDFTGNYEVTGDLTVRGVTEEVTFPAYITMEGSKVYAKTGEISLDRTRWNVNYQSKKIFKNLTDKFIKDEMIVSLDLEFNRG